MSRILLLLITLISSSQLMYSQVLAGDDCSTAPTISNNSCTSFAAQTYTISDSSSSPFYHCDGVLYRDAWVKVTVPASGNLSMTMSENGNSYNYRMAVFSDSCGNLNYITCGLSYSPGYPRILLRNRPPNEVIYIRVWTMPLSSTNASIANFPFNICASDPIIPLNDSCTAPTTLAVNPYQNLVPIKDSLTNATNSEQLPYATCTVFPRNDLWYSATVPANGNIGFAFPQDSNGNASITVTVYSGSCNNLSQISCVNVPSDNVTVTNQTPNTNLLIRVSTYSSSIQTFNIGAFSFSAPPNNDCSQATFVPTQTSCYANTTFRDSILYAATLSSFPLQCNPLNFNSNADVWYKTSIPSSGNLAIEVPNGIRIELYDNNCSNPNLIGCSDASNPLILENQNPNDTVLIRAWSTFGNLSTLEFCITDPIIPSNNSCNAPILLNVEVGDSCNTSSYNTRYITKETLIYDSCNSIGRDLWYSIVVPATGKFYFRPLHSSFVSYDISTSLYNAGDCDSLIPIACNYYPYLSSPFGGQLFTEFSNLPPADTLLLRLSVEFGFGVPFAIDPYLDFCLSEDFTFGTFPITLSYFKGSIDKEQNNLTWQTVSEINSKKFEIERMNVDQNWVTIGKQDAKGNSNEKTFYTFADTEPLQNSYYRLKMIDFDKKFDYSNVINISRTKETKSISIYPNPSNSFVIMNFKNIEDIQSVVLYNSFGKQIKKIDFLNTNKVYLNNLPAGLYLFRTTTSYGIELHKIIKE